MPETWSVPPRVLADAVDLRELVRLGQVNDGLAGKADAGHVHDARYVDFVSDQAIGGVKSFTTSGSPLVPAPTAPENPVRWGDRAPAGGTSSSTLSVTQTYSIDAGGAPVRYFTLTANPTLAVPTNGVDGQTVRLWLLGSGATRTFTFASGYEVSPAVPSRTISIATGTWELIEIERRAGTWRLVGTDQTLNAPAPHASTHAAGGGDPLLGTAATVSATNTSGTDATSSSTTWAAAPNTGVAFVAPPSGKVLVEISAFLITATAGNASYFTPVVLTGATVGSGSSVLAADVNNGISNNNANWITTSRSTLLTGLTPGAAYNAQGYVRSSSTVTARAGAGRVVVIPQLA